MKALGSMTESSDRNIKEFIVGGLQKRFLCHRKDKLRLPVKSLLTARLHDLLSRRRYSAGTTTILTLKIKQNAIWNFLVKNKTNGYFL